MQTENSLRRFGKENPQDFPKVRSQTQEIKNKTKQKRQKRDENRSHPRIQEQVIGLLAREKWEEKKGSKEEDKPVRRQRWE